MQSIGAWIRSRFEIRRNLASPPLGAVRADAAESRGPLSPLQGAAARAVTGTRQPKRASRLLLCGVLILEGACVYPGLPPAVPMLGGSSLSVGEWKGTTSQGKPIAFSVSPDEKVTSITVEYEFNGCSGVREFQQLSVPTAPDVTCIPGPCSRTLNTYRAFGFSDGTVAAGPYTQINGVFLPRNQARGQAIFSNFEACGSATVQWTATRR